MILAIDVDYRTQGAKAAGVSFSDWQDECPTEVYHTYINDIAEYEPGQFYKREMPCILQLLKSHQLLQSHELLNSIELLNKHPMNLSCIVIDGFVTLGKEQKPGLGWHLYQALKASIPIIGVAKKAFKDTPDNTQIFRGESANPLFVSAIGMALDEAMHNIQNMHGKHRLPTLLKRVDSECRKP